MKHNAIQRYKNVCEMAIDPPGSDILERSAVQANAIKVKAEYEEKFRTAKKYKDDPEILELLNPKTEEKTDNAKQPKGRNKTA